MQQERLRVGFIGCGTIGQETARLVAERASTDIVLVGALVQHPALIRSPVCPDIAANLAALLAKKPHVVVEVAGHEGLREHGPAILRAGIDLLLISVGALADQDFLRELLDAAQRGGSQAKIASGAIGALDALAAASLGNLTQVVHTMRKRPETLLPSEEIKDLQTPREIFRGNARQAAKQFPEFLNVAAAVALASNGFDQMQVRVFADPTVKYSRHEVLAEGDFGVLRFEIENVPISFPARGAKLVAMSIVRTLLLRRASLVIG